MNRRIPLILIFTAGLPATVSMADDLNPPTWRDGALSVFAEWDWATPPSNLGFMPPDVITTESGTSDPSIGPNGEVFYMGFNTHAEVDLTTNWMWTPGDGDGGLTPTQPGASLAFNVQNWVDDEPEKYIRIQVTYQGDGPPPTIGSLFGVVEPDGAQFDGELIGRFDEPGYFFLDYLVQPNPDWEHIVMDVPLSVTLDQVVIDTISIPGPAGVALLAIAPLVTRRRR